MKVVSNKQKGYRMMKCIKFKHGKTNIKSKRPFWIEPVFTKDSSWWFSTETGEWYNGYDNVPKGGRCSSYYAMAYAGFNNIYSLKAAKRKISKWNVPKGTKFRVSLPFVGYDFIVTKP
jgi:hypothetical protein